jgi:hypothetical protein
MSSTASRTLLPEPVNVMHVQIVWPCTAAEHLARQARDLGEVVKIDLACLVLEMAWLARAFHAGALPPPHEAVHGEGDDDFP